MIFQLPNISGEFSYLRCFNVAMNMGMARASEGLVLGIVLDLELGMELEMGLMVGLGKG